MDAMEREARDWHAWLKEQKPPFNSLSFHRMMQERHGRRWQRRVVDLLRWFIMEKKNKWT